MAISLLQLRIVFASLPVHGIDSVLCTQCASVAYRFIRARTRVCVCVRACIVYTV